MAWTDGSKMIRNTTDGEEDPIPSGKSNRVDVFALGSSVSVDPPTILADGSEVSVVVDEGAFWTWQGIVLYHGKQVQNVLNEIKPGVSGIATRTGGFVKVRCKPAMFRV